MALHHSKAVTAHKNSINRTVKYVCKLTLGKVKIVSTRHFKKLGKFWKRKALMRNETKSSMYIKHTVHNFSSYVLSDEKYKVLSYGLDHCIPTPCNYSAVETEFELFYQNILSSISHIP